MTLMAPLPSPESRFDALLREARNGSDEARWLVVQLFRTSLLAIANRKIDSTVHAREAPSDIVQETILEAKRDLDRFRGMTEGEMRAWLGAVLVHNIRNLNRKHHAEMRDVNRERSLAPKSDWQTPVVADPGPSPSGVLMRQETAEALEVAIRGLPDDYRRIIDLRYRRRLSYEEIALAMGRTELATRRLWSRALHKLSRRMQSQQQ